MKSDLQGRFATADDAALIAPLNAQLIRDEGHRNPMSVSELEQRMADWLLGDYRAALFESDRQTVAYALWRREPEYVYLRQLFVVPSKRRGGIGRAALDWLWHNAWPDADRLRIDVLVDNKAGQRFWRAIGFKDYLLAMEMQRPG